MRKFIVDVWNIKHLKANFDEVVSFHRVSFQIFPSLFISLFSSFFICILILRWGRCPHFYNNNIIMIVFKKGNHINFNIVDSEDLGEYLYVEFTA